MKVLVKILGLAMIAIVATSCQRQSAEAILANETQQQAIMDSIANDHNMSMKMMNTMMNNDHSKMMLMGNKDMMKMMMGNQEMMQSMMQENPEMMNNMMGMMMNAAKGDSSRMMSMCQKIIGNPQMSGMMQNMMKQKKSGMGMMN